MNDEWDIGTGFAPVAGQLEGEFGISWQFGYAGGCVNMVGRLETGHYINVTDYQQPFLTPIHERTGDHGFTIGIYDEHQWGGCIKQICGCKGPALYFFPYAWPDDLRGGDPHRAQGHATPPTHQRGDLPVNKNLINAAVTIPAVLAGLLGPVGMGAGAGEAQADTVIALEGLLQRNGKTATAFEGAMCEQHECVSINNKPSSISRESQRLQVAVDNTTGNIILVGWSLGAAVTHDRLQEWAENPELAPDSASETVRVVTFGNPKRKYGGQDADRGPLPTAPDGQQYQHLDVTMQYDSVSDQPDRRGYYSQINLAFARHFDYYDKGVNLNDPTNLVYREGETTYMLIEADVLPMLKWRDWFTSDEKMAELDAKYRPLIEKDYDRPAYVEQGEGADWVNGVEPESLRDESEIEEEEEKESSDARKAAIDDMNTQERSSASRKARTSTSTESTSTDSTPEDESISQSKDETETGSTSTPAGSDSDSEKSNDDSES